MNKIDTLKKMLGIDISNDLLIDITFEMSRYYDSLFTSEIKKIQKKQNIIIDSPSRKQMRKKFYYGNLFDIETKYDIAPCDYSNREDVNIVIDDSISRLNTYDPNKIIESIKKRVSDLKDNVNADSNMSEWLKYYDERRKSSKYSLVAYVIDQTIFESNNFNENLLLSFINKTYTDLENYRYMSIVVNGDLFNKDGDCITWKMLYKAGIYAENFIQFKDAFFPFHKNKQINSLTEFLSTDSISNAEKLSEDFYNSISTGYRFEDCYISDNQQTKILIYKKIKLDNSNVPCPSCNTTKQSGNSYPEVFLRSWECKNPTCPDRSKSGRGKRFDEYGTYRYFKLVENDENNRIDESLYQSWHRDIFSSELSWSEFLIKEYSYSGERIALINYKPKDLFNRKFAKISLDKMKTAQESIVDFSSLPIFKFYKEVLSNCKLKVDGKTVLKNDIEVINDNSTDYLQRLSKNQIGTAITSPPYYNAREYSQWGTMIMYFVDMLLNAKAVYNAMADDSYYLYNIGDIVSEDNIYVVSNMSKHRVQLGFLSCLIFEIAGFNLTGNIIWDKGEVQSKRNSTVNLVSGYVKCINCYEHVLVFRKGPFEIISNSVKRITPVIKINSKGENTYKHTAPYPMDLVDLIQPYVNKELYVLDPFLGSGTTLKWCRKNGIKGIGFELNEEYYKLCLSNIFKDEENHQLSLF